MVDILFNMWIDVAEPVGVELSPYYLQYHKVLQIQIGLQTLFWYLNNIYHFHADSNMS